MKLEEGSVIKVEAYKNSHLVRQAMFTVNKDGMDESKKMERYIAARKEEGLHIALWRSVYRKEEGSK